MGATTIRFWVDIKLYVDSRDQDSNGVNLIVDYYIESFRTNSSNRK